MKEIFENRSVNKSVNEKQNIIKHISQKLCNIKRKFPITNKFKNKASILHKIFRWVFVVTQNEIELTNFYYEMTTQHQNLEFTLERPVGGKLPFLDF